MKTLDGSIHRRGHLADLAPVLERHCVRLYGSELRAVFVIGSYASGKSRPSSDLDLLIVVGLATESTRRRALTFGEPDGYHGPELSPIIYTKAEFLRFPSFVLTLLDAHRVIYSRASQGADEAQELVRAVKEYVRINGITRVPHKGGYYWKGIPTGRAAGGR